MLDIEVKDGRIADAMNALKELTKCNISLKMDAYTLDQRPDYTGKKRDGLETLERVILAMPDFNARCNRKIIRGLKPFRDFYLTLPVGEYGEKNPNNGCATFAVELPDDSTIILTSDDYDFDKAGCRFDKAGLEHLANEYGREWKADEISVVVEKRENSPYDIYDCTIRFWWD